MKRVQLPETAGKNSLLLEWQTCGSESAWQAALHAPPLYEDACPTPDSRLGRTSHRWWAGVLFLAALFVGAGWVWHTANAKLGQIEAELQKAVEGDLWQVTHTQMGIGSQRPPAMDAIVLRNRVQSTGSHPLATSVKVLSLRGETAVVEVEVHTGPEQPVLRQTRVYRHNTMGWQRSEPVPELWGSPRRKESNYFVFHYYARDEAAVAAAAVKLDGLFDKWLADWTALSDEASGAPEDAKVQVVIDLVGTTGVIPQRNGKDQPFVIASPAAYLDPHTITDADLLAQALFLGLVYEYMAKASESHAVPAHWKPLWDGLRLWWVWAPDLPLAATRERVVQWVFSDVEPAKQDDSFHTLAFYDEMCALHRLWMLTPLEIQVPLVCGNRTLNEYLQRWRESYSPPLQLAHLVMLTPSPKLRSVTDRLIRPAHLDNAIVLATVVEYAAATYGQERLPLLVAGLNEYSNWESLTPAVFGVSAAEFEIGWRHYLAERYAIFVEP